MILELFETAILVKWRQTLSNGFGFALYMHTPVFE